jgi:hypothetical protein
MSDTSHDDRDVTKAHTQSPAGTGWSQLEQIGPGTFADAGSAAGDHGGGESDGGFSVGEPAGGQQPPVHAAHRGFSIVHVRILDDDREWVRSRERLSATVYTRQVALRYTADRAKNDQEPGYLALIDPSGRAVGAFVTGTGRAASSEATKIVRRALAVAGQTRKRTSRRPSSNKRTSRRK